MRMKAANARLKVYERNRNIIAVNKGERCSVLSASAGNTIKRIAIGTTDKRAIDNCNNIQRASLFCNGDSILSVSELFVRLCIIYFGQKVEIPSSGKDESEYDASEE